MIDIGVNLADASFDSDRDEVVQRARDAGVETMIITGTDVNQSAKARDLANHYSLYSTAGIHPHHAESMDATSMDALRSLSADNRVVAIGECGLDYFRDIAPRDIQKECLIQHIECAIEIDMPLFLHERDAADDMTTILKQYSSSLPPTVIHCFTGDKETLFRYLDLGLYIGVTGWVCDERRGHALQECVSSIPHDRLMIETDAPYLLPRSLRPKPKHRRNEPMHLNEVARVIASLCNESKMSLAERSAVVARKFFGI